MDQRGAAERTRREIVRLSHAGLDARTLRVETLRRLRQVVPLDSAWFATADPATLLFTSTVVEEIPEHATPAFLANEFFEDDVNKWVHLARARRPAAPATARSWRPSASRTSCARSCSLASPAGG